MKNLWSPWRNEYITGFSTKKEKPKCFLCHAAEEKEDLREVVFIGNEAFIIMNKFPYNNGHLLIAPKKHIDNIIELPKSIYNEINDLIYLSIKALNKLYKPQGINVGLNMGSAAGAGVPGHLHYHVLPRWEGDTNFMMTVADTKVVSEAMEIGSIRLRDYFNNSSD